MWLQFLFLKNLRLVCSSIFMFRLVFRLKIWKCESCQISFLLSIQSQHISFILLWSRAGISPSFLNSLFPPQRLISFGSPIGQAACFLAQDHIYAYLSLGQYVVVHSFIHSSFLLAYFCCPRWGQYIPPCGLPWPSQSCGKSWLMLMITLLASWSGDRWLPTLCLWSQLNGIW